MKGNGLIISTYIGEAVNFRFQAYIKSSRIINETTLFSLDL